MVWKSSKDELPESGRSYIVVYGPSEDRVITKLARYDGEAWVDIDGFRVWCVYAYTEIGNPFADDPPKEMRDSWRDFIGK